MTTVNYFGIEKTAIVTRAIVVVVLVSLAIVVAATLFGGELDTGHLMPVTQGGPYGVLQAAGFLFFAFAGYARLATLGEEVVDPARTIPRAIPMALGITLLVYAAVAVSALLAVDAQGWRGPRRRWRLPSKQAVCRRRARGQYRRRRGVARRAAVADRRRQPDDIRDGRQPRSSAFLRRRPSAPSRFRTAPNSVWNRGRLDRRIRRICVRRSASARLPCSRITPSTNASAFTLQRVRSAGGRAGLRLLVWRVARSLHSPCPCSQFSPAPPFWPQGRLSFYCGQDFPPLQKTMPRTIHRQTSITVHGSRTSVLVY